MIRSKTSVAVFVKTPGLSSIKTRLAKGVGESAALEFYQRSCRHIANELKKLSNTEVYWAIAEDPSENHPVQSRYWADFPTIYQGEGGLGERMHNVYQQLRAKSDRVIFLGADAPHLDFARLIEQADLAPIVFGPAQDGGFYLFSSNQDIPKSVWTGVTYSSDTTLKEFVTSLESHVTSNIRFLSENFDVDDFSCFFNFVGRERDEKYIAIVDPALKRPEVESLNLCMGFTERPCRYFLPVYGTLLPEPDDAIAGVVVMGSGASVNDGLEWQKSLETWVGDVMSRDIPVFGICYGHQLIAAMLGGDVGAARADGEKIRGLREIQFKENPCFGQWTGNVVVSHNEAVQRGPSEMEVLATSSEFEFDGFFHKERPVLTLQGHPEAMPSFIEGFGVSPKDLQFGHRIVERFFHFIESRGTL